MKLSGKLYHSFHHLKSRHKIIIIVLLCMIMGYVYLLLTKSQFNSESQIASQYFIRREASRLVGKEPNDLTDDDFSKITGITFGYMRHYDLTLLKKFTNLKRLYFADGRMPGADKKVIPKWKSILAKSGIIDLTKDKCFDLKPIGKLSNLEELVLSGSRISDIRPLAKLKNLKSLRLSSSRIHNLKPIKNLTNLEELDIVKVQISNIDLLKGMNNLRSLRLYNTNVSDLEPLRGLNNLQKLEVSGSNVSDLEPLSGLINLQTLNIAGTKVTDLSPLKGLTNLKTLTVPLQSKKIMEEEVDKLREFLPDFEMRWGS